MCNTPGHGSFSLPVIGVQDPHCLVAVWSGIGNKTACLGLALRED